MNKKKRSTGLWRGLTAIVASLLALAVGVAFITDSNASVINARLGLTNFKVVDTEDGAKKDSTYFKSEFSSLGEVIAAKDALAVQIASEGAVLFKNHASTLPLDISSEKVTLWGLNAINPTIGGMIGSNVAVAEDAGQVQYDLVTALNTRGFSLNQEMLSFYQSDEVNKEYGRKKGHSLSPSFGKMYENPDKYKIGEAPASVYTDAVLASADDTVALVVLSRDNSEAADYSTSMVSKADTDSFERPLALSENEKAMIELAKAHSTKVVVLLNCSNPIEIEELKNDDAIGAILWAGIPGANGLLGVADVLSGAVNPSGHITDTYAVNSTSAPAMVNYGVYMYTNNSKTGTGDLLGEDDKGDWYLVESEGIYTGYKYYETRYEDLVLGQGNADAAEGTFASSTWNWDDEVSYSFGYGLSYTTFEQKLDSVEVNVGGTGTAKVTVTNTGDVAGKSVVQLYVQSPYKAGGLEKSAIQLVAFEKTAVLEPGASEEVTVEFDPAYFASYDENAVKADGTQGAWVLEDGDYYFAIGNGAHEALNNVLAKKTGSEDGLVKTADTEQIVADNAVVWNLANTDIETYSVGVQNQLQDMNINNLIADTVEYTTRSDWSKGWTPVAAFTPTEAMMIGLTNKNYTLNENSGESGSVAWGVNSGLKLIDAVVTDDDGTYLGVLPLDDPFWDQLVDQVTLDEAINFLEKAGDDFENIDSIQLARVFVNDGPLGYASDQVGGYFVRWSADAKDQPYYTAETDEFAAYRMATMPTEPVVAATFNKELIQREGELLGEDGLYAKESGIIAPGLNLHRTVYCARNHEYYSEDPVLSACAANAVCIGLKNKGTMGEPKHLAFNHQESNRSGVSTFMTEQAARENELRAFQLSMSQNNAQGIMTAFNRAGTVFAGAYRSMLVNICRDEWGYEGWIVTDLVNGADYMNWRDVIASGGGATFTTSAFDTSNIGNMAASKSLIEKDVHFQEEMKESLKYYLYQIAQSNAMNGVSSTTQIVHVRTWVENAVDGALACFGVLTALCLALAVINDVKSGKKAKKA